MILWLALACASPKREKERVWESLADPRYASAPSLPDAFESRIPATDADDGTATADGFLEEGRDGVNVARGSDAIVLRFGAVPSPVFARLVLPVSTGFAPQEIRITAEIDGVASTTEVRWRIPEPWPDPWKGATRADKRAPVICAPFERETPDLSEILREVNGRPLVLRLEAVKGALGVYDSATTEDLECPGRLAPILEVAPTLRAALGGKELVGRPTDRSVTVAVFPWVAVEVAVALGGVVGPFRPAPAGVSTEILLDGLTPDTAYEWQLVVRRGETVETGPVQHFRTQRAPGEAFTFAVTADGHFLNMENRRAYSSMKLLADTYAAIGAERPDFVLDLGDSFNSESYRSFDAPDAADALRRHLAVRPYFERAGAPLMMVLGNHEGEQGWNPALRDRAAEARHAVYPNPSPDAFYSGNQRDPLARDYYAFTWGDALIVVLDPYRYTTTKPHEIDGGDGSRDRWDWTLGEAQYRWLVTTLESSRATWKLVFSHQVTGGTNDYGRGGRMAAGTYEWGGAGKEGKPAFNRKRPGWGRPIHRVLADTGTTAFVHGHDHVFAWEPPLDGVGYLTAPQPGDAKYDAGHSERTGIAPGSTVIANAGYLRFRASPEALTVAYVRQFLPGDGNDGEVAFEWTVTDCDRNGVSDLHDLARGAGDADQDGLYDACE